MNAPTAARVTAFGSSIMEVRSGVISNVSIASLRTRIRRYWAGLATYVRHGYFWIHFWTANEE